MADKPPSFGAYETPTTLENINDRVDDWHEGAGEIPTGELPIEEHLGMSPTQYAAWVETGKMPCLHLTGYWIREGAAFRCYECQCQFHLDDLPKLPREIEEWEG